jgi:hypothetical protein
MLKENMYITLSDLKKRGWTDNIIQKMQLQPDKVVKNPCFSKAPPMKLFLISQVENCEKTEQFAALVDKSKRRKIGASKAVKTKTKKLFAFIDSVEIKVQFVPEPLLTEKAIHAYNTWQNNRPSVINGNNEGFYADINSDSSFLDRIKSNYIRHNLTNYDEILEEIKGKTGITEVYPELKKRVQERIKEEWNRQKSNVL